MIVVRYAAVLLVVCFVQSFTAPSLARDAGAVSAQAVQTVNASDLSAQQRRPRTRVRVYPQPPFWEYPRPGTHSYPGPNAKRDCRAWYVIENRPSGAVMTPRMRCDWVPG